MMQIIKAGQLSVDCLEDDTDVRRVHQMTDLIFKAGGKNVKIFTSNRDPSPGRHFEYISEKPVPGTEPDPQEIRSFSGRDYDELFCEGPETPYKIVFDKEHSNFKFVHPALFLDGQTVFTVDQGEVVKVTTGRFQQRKEIAEYFNNEFRIKFGHVDDVDETPLGLPYFYAADPVKEEFGEMMKRAAMMLIANNNFSSQILLIAMGSSTAFVGLFNDVHDLLHSIQNIEGAKKDKISVIYRDEDQEEGLYGTKIVMSASQMLALAKVKTE